MSTKKVKSAGRFGVRYGKRVRDRISKVESQARRKFQCPSCLREALKRISVGIWQCRKCGMKMAGGAYTPRTMAVAKIIRSQK